MVINRSTNPRPHHDPARVRADADAARALLDSHVPDRDTGLCPICLTPAPCAPANAAANRLHDLGQPLTPPATGTPPPRRRWLAWLTPHRGDRVGRRRRITPPTAPLLTHAWRTRLHPHPTARHPRLAA